MEYVGAYLHTIKKNQYNASTIMFVYKDKVKGAEQPVVVPFEMESFDDKSLRTASYNALLQEDGHMLDMILYAHFEDGHKKKDKFSVTFGCRDAKGNTIHRMYSVENKGTKIKGKLNIPFFNVWTPCVGTKKKLGFERFSDPILLKLATDFTMLKSDKEEKARSKS